MKTCGLRTVTLHGDKQCSSEDVAAIKKELDITKAFMSFIKTNDPKTYYSSLSDCLEADEIAAMEPEVFAIVSPIDAVIYVSGVPTEISGNQYGFVALTPDENGVIYRSQIPNIDDHTRYELHLWSVQTVDYLNLKGIQWFGLSSDGVDAKMEELGYTFQYIPQYIGKISNMDDIIGVDWFCELSYGASMRTTQLCAIYPQPWNMPNCVNASNFFRIESSDKNDSKVLETMMSELNFKSPAPFGNEVYGWLFCNVKSYDFPTIDVKGHSNNMRMCIRRSGFTWTPEQEQHMIVKNLGDASSSSYNIDFCGLVTWARQDIIDTLVTYSPGPNTLCAKQVSLHPTAIAGLTNEDKLAIANNGWTIISKTTA